MHLFEACPKIYFGEDSLNYLLDIPREKVLLVTDPFMVKSGAVKAVTSRLEQRGADYAVFSDIEPDPSIETVASGLSMFFLHKPGTVIALGGGSAIDATKAMLFFCLRFQSEISAGNVQEPLFVAIPTTSGTGSEVTSYAVVSDKQRGVKIPLSDRSMIPDVAILDPEFTKTLPKDMVAFTGIDVLTHAIEAYVNPLHNDFTDMCARDAARKVLRYLPRLYSDVADVKMREKMFTASTLAGLAFTNSGLGVCHGLAHTIGAEFHIPHGKANAMTLPFVIAFNAGLGHYHKQGIAQRYADLAHNMRVEGHDVTDSCRRLIATVQVLAEWFGVPAGLRACGVSQADYEARRAGAADKVMADATTKANPVPVTREDVLTLLDDVFRGELAY